MILLAGILVFFVIFSFIFFVHSYTNRSRIVERMPSPAKIKKSISTDLYSFWGVSEDTLLSPNEAFGWAVGCGGFVGLGIGFIEPMIGIAVGMMIFLFIPRFIQTFKVGSKIKDFRINMEFVVSILESGLKAGMGFKEALAETARTSPKAIKDEIERVHLAITVTNSPPAIAFAQLASRIPCTETEELRDAIELYSRVGGREALDLLQSVLSNIREGITARSRVNQETKGVKTSGLIVGALPLIYIIAMQFIAPDLMKTLFQTEMGKMILLGCVLLYLFGVWLMYTILKGVEEF